MPFFLGSYGEVWGWCPGLWLFLHFLLPVTRWSPLYIMFEIHLDLFGGRWVGVVVVGWVVGGVLGGVVYGVGWGTFQGSPPGGLKKSDCY